MSSKRPDTQAKDSQLTQSVEATVMRSWLKHNRVTVNVIAHSKHWWFFLSWGGSGCGVGPDVTG